MDKVTLGTSKGSRTARLLGNARTNGSMPYRWRCPHHHSHLIACIVVRRFALSLPALAVFGHRSLQAGSVYRIGSRRRVVFGSLAHFLILASLLYQHSVNSGSNPYREA